MAYASWAHVSPQSGSGNGATNWTGDSNTGRNQRTTTAQYKAGSIIRTANIIQAGSPVFINVTNPAGTADAQNGGTSTYNAANTGGNLTIQGTTNAVKLTYSIQSIQGVDGSLSIVLPNSYTANSNSTVNGATITGDPGASAAFSFSIPLTLPANTTVDTLGCLIHIVGEDASNNTCEWDVTIIEAAGDAYLYLDKMNNVTDITVNLSAAGTPAQTVNVLSNTSWTIS